MALVGNYPTCFFPSSVLCSDANTLPYKRSSDKCVLGLRWSLLRPSVAKENGHLMNQTRLPYSVHGPPAI